MEAGTADIGPFEVARLCGAPKGRADRSYIQGISGKCCRGIAAKFRPKGQLRPIA